MTVPKDEKVNDPCKYMSQLARAFLPLEKWGFRERYRSNREEILIHDSEWCRVKFVWGGWEAYTGNTISIYYGRLHALDNHDQMVWNEEECYCWHREELALHFLDGRIPEYAAAHIYSHSLKQRFRQQDLELKLTGERNQPEWLVRMHALIWEQYAPRLFEIFDLHRTDLWQDYRKFLKEVYDIAGRSPAIKPALDKVC